MFPGKRTTRHKNITKLDYEKTGQGYLVRLSWKGKQYKATFMISEYGDWLAALDAAIEWRNTMEIQIGKPRSERFVCGQSHSNTGEVGIHRTVSGPQGCEIYEVSWVEPDGRAGKTKVSIAKHGEKRALQRAKRIRRRHEEERQAAPKGVRAKAHRWLCPVCKNQRRLPSDARTPNAAHLTERQQSTMTTATATVATDTAAVVRTRKPDPRTQVFAEANVEVWSVTGREPRYEILKDGVEAHRIVATRTWRAEQALVVTIGKALVVGATVAQAVQGAALMGAEAAAGGQPPAPPSAPVAAAAADPDPQPSNGVPIAQITVAKVPADQANNGGQPAKRTIEDFLFDPPVLLPDGLEVPTRGVLPVVRDGVWHLFDRIGMQHYPNVADYIEESRRWGISRRLSINVPFDKLTPASRLILVHDRAYVANALAYGFWRCPKGLAEHDIHANIPGVVCAGVWWEDLDPRHASPGQVGRDVERVLPSCSYRARITPQSLTPDRRAGIFASFPISRLVVVRGNAHEEGLSAARTSKLPVFAV